MHLPVWLFDCNNYVRRRHEVDTSGLVLRNLFNEAFHSPNPIIYVFDGKNSKASRKALYPEYKANRIPAPDAFYATLGMFKELMGHTNKISLEIEGYEADDVIATLVRNNPGTIMKIFSNDGDFMQLCNDFVTMSDPKLPKISMEDIRLYKTLVGDKSDNIKGINKFGEVGFLKLTAEQKALWGLWLDEQTIAGELSAEALGLSKSQFTWFSENKPLIRAYWQIVNFIKVPAELIAKNMKVGKPNLELANELLKGVYQ